MHSLRLRLFLTWLTIIVLAVALVLGFANWGTANAFTHYVDRSLQREEAIMGTLIETQVQAEGIENIESFVAEMGELYGRSITLADADGDIIISSIPGSVSGRVTVSGTELGTQPGFALPPATFLVEPGEWVALMEEEIIRGETAVPFSRSITIESTVSEGLIMAPTSNEQLFLGSVTRLFWLAAIGAIAFTGLLGLGLSRRILQPVESLTLAAHQMATGDLSQRVAVQRPDEIGQLATAFNQMADSLARQETLRRHLVTDVAHELRTPLSNIRGYLEAVQDGVLPSDAATIDTIHEEALLLSRLIEDLQELSLAEAGQLRLERQALSLIDLVKQAVNSVRPLAISQTITLQTELPDDLPPVWADRERVGQLLRNLLRNAMSHTPPAGTITITAVSRDEAVQVSVRDTGEGIAPEHIPHIFDRFYRADPSRDRASGSAGLGLAIAKAVVELHHGRIWVESQPGMGAVFTFTLPVTT